MLLTQLDHVTLPAPDLAAASGPFEQLGLRLTPAAVHPGLGTENRVFFAGGSPESHMYVELLALRDRDEAVGAGSERRGWLLRALERPPALARIAFATVDVAAASAALRPHGLTAEPYQAFRADGSLIADVLPLTELAPFAGVDLVLVSDPRPRAAVVAHRAADGLLAHTFPLKRLDHLAASVPDLEAATKFWVDVLGVPVWGEVTSPVMVIRQMRAGDMVFELLAASGPGSPLASRPPGLSSMCAFEVESLDDAVALARSRGFSPPDPAPGVLPGTRTATIPADQLSGLALQLVQYV